MPYDDDDDLFNHEFDFVDDDDDDAKPSKAKDEAEPKTPRRRSASGDKAGKPPARVPRKGTKPPAADAKRPARAPRRDAAKPPAPPQQPMEPAPQGYLMDDPPLDDEPSELEVAAEAEAPAPAVPTGPPADHVVHIYEYGEFKRTINRKFTDEEAVSFAEEYTRTGKCYGRYAIATPDDEEPAPTFAAAKG